MFRILVVCAMEEEALHFKNLFEKPFINGKHMSSFFMNKGRIDLLVTGIGMVNSTFETTAHLLNHTKPIAIINYGCVGAHCPKLRINDIVIGDASIPIAHTITYNNGEIREFYGVRNFDNISTKKFISDSSLLFISKYIVDKTEISYSVGNVASSDTWNADIKTVDYMRTLFGTVCEDMESAAIAQISEKLDIPYICIKDVSNSVHHPTKEEFEPFGHIIPKSSGQRSALVTYMICSILLL